MDSFSLLAHSTDLDSWPGSCSRATAASLTLQARNETRAEAARRAVAQARDVLIGGPLVMPGAHMLLDLSACVPD